MKRVAGWVVGAVVLCGLVLIPGQSEARRNWGTERPPYGFETRHLPPRARVIRSPRFGEHYYHRGIFYQPFGPVFRVVRPPIGLIVTHLPLGYIELNFGGHPYARYNDIYYRPVRQGYMVVEPPVEAPPAPQPDVTAVPSQSLGEAVVTVEVLNVRSGPSRLQPVVEHVAQGDALIILGSAPDWYYVRLPNGSFGWVWADFIRTDLKR
ncbi:MAG: SH3 domain-containing protein [Desulfuromonadaceae bacterium]|nr:SH3 domain-containing protein [Desulfuromonadaceae bacterium]